MNFLQPWFTFLKTLFSNLVKERGMILSGPILNEIIYGNKLRII